MTLFTRALFFTVLSTVAFTAETNGQAAAEPSKKVNFGYSRNPKTKNKAGEQEEKKPVAAPEAKRVTIEDIGEPPVLVSETKAPDAEPVENYSSAAETLAVARRAGSAAASPTEIYKVGVGDVLFISLQNAGAKGSTYFTVLGDGTIDYPLASEMVAVAGLTVEEIEDLLKERVKLFQNPQISVRVREHASHSITVLGLVEKSGEKFLQREAIPLYVVRADAVVSAKANQVVIKRHNATTEIVDLQDAKNDDVLIFPGDILEFKSAAPEVAIAVAPQYYYIGGAINSAGQKDFHNGITLTQAIFASGGARKSNARRVVIRRKNEQGLLSPITFDLAAIKNGKQPDPMLEAGDTVEIVK